MKSDLQFPLLMLAIVLSVALWSFIGVVDMFTWKLETFPAFLGVALLLATYRKFRFTDLLYALMAMHAIILLIGGHYTYAEVPWFNGLRDHYHWGRNMYDRLGHFVQGLVPAMIARELLLRTSPLKPGKWLFAIIVLSCLGISAGYELLEWQVSIHTGEGADAFLGTQGDIWDTQEDMAMALIGALAALLLLDGWHDKLLMKFRKENGNAA
jgi:putative membrane protein